MLLETLPQIISSSSIPFVVFFTLNNVCVIHNKISNGVNFGLKEYLTVLHMK